MGRFKVRNIIRKQNGITLIEVLAAFVLISILTIILINVQIGSQKQYNQQFETNSEINEVSYALKVITKEIRMTSNPSYIIEKANGVQINSDLYEFDKQKNQINKNSEPFIENVKNFKVTKSGNNCSIIIEGTKGYKQQTVINLRGDNNEG